MAKRKFLPGAVKYVAFPGRYASVTILEPGTGGQVLRKKHADPYVVRDCDGQVFVMPGSKLYDDPVAASVAATKLAHKLGVVVDDDDDDDEEEDDDDEDEEDEEPEDEDDEDDEDDEEEDEEDSED